MTPAAEILVNAAALVAQSGVMVTLSIQGHSEEFLAWAKRAGLAVFSEDLERQDYGGRKVTWTLFRVALPCEGDISVHGPDHQAPPKPSVDEDEVVF